MRDGSFLILFKDDEKKEVFLVFRSDFPVWGLTGGGIEEGETPQEAAIREAKEETGFKVKLLKEIGVYKLVKNDKVIKNTYLYEGRVVSGTFKPEFVGCKGRWFEIDHLPVDLIVMVRQMIVDASLFNGVSFSKKISREFKLSDFKIIFRHPLAAIKFFMNKR